MFNDLYSKEVLKYFRNPQNMGEIKNPDGVGTVGNPVCGDIIKYYLTISKNDKGEEIVKNVKFQTLGCAAAIATSSYFTKMVKGKKLSEAIKLTRSDLVSKLGGLPKTKIHCSVLAVDCFKKAVDNYRQKK